MNIYEKICEKCHRQVGVSEAIIDHKMYYHESCYDAKTGNKIRTLHRLVANGQINAQQMQELGELESLLNKQPPDKEARNFLNYRQISAKTPTKTITDGDKVSFGNRVDTQALLESGTMKESTDMNPETGKAMIALTEGDGVCPLCKGMLKSVIIDGYMTWECSECKRKPVINIMPGIVCERHPDMVSYNELKQLYGLDEKGNLILPKQLSGSNVPKQLSAPKPVEPDETKT